MVSKLVKWSLDNPLLVMLGMFALIMAGAMPS